MAKELILVLKRKYEELLKSGNHRDTEMTRQVDEHEKPEDSDPVKEVSMQTGNGQFVEKLDTNEHGTPGILDRPPKIRRKTLKKNVKWISF